MSVHTCATFWEALRKIVPNLPAHDVTRCVITIDPSTSPDPLVGLTILARDDEGRIYLDLEGTAEAQRIASDCKWFKIVPIEGAPT